MIEQSEVFLEKDEFVVWTPSQVIIEKAGDSATGRRIGGFASTEGRDRQGEIVVQKGLDFSEFVNHGYFNDNHRQDTDAVVGIPETAKYHKGKGWFVKGYLLKTPLSDRIFNLAKALEDTPRRLGFSVEGKVLQRGENNKILRALIRNVAVTNRPVNTDCTWDVLSKAFGSTDEIEECYQSYMDKALSAGASVSPVAGGNALREEGLDKNKRKTTFGFEDDEETTVEKGMLFKRGAKTFNQAVQFLKLIRPHYSERVCERLVSLSMKMKEV